MAFTKNPLKDGTKTKLKDYSVDLEIRVGDGLSSVEFTGTKGGSWGNGQGYIKDPTTGIITQWKQDSITLSSGEGAKATSLPISFPNALLGAVISMNALNDVDSLELPKITHSVYFFNRQAGQVRLKHSSLGANYKITYTVIAIGY